MRYIVAFLILVGMSVPSYSQHWHGHRHYVPHHRHYVPHHRHYHPPRVIHRPPAYYPPPRAYYPPPRAYYPPPVHVPRHNRWRERAATAAIIAIFGTAAAYYAYCNNNPYDDYCI